MKFKFFSMFVAEALLVALISACVRSPMETPQPTSIVVSATTGATTITTNGGTLQMQANVQPANASNQVVWSVTNGTGRATINASGVLTAVGNGTVTVRATAADAPGVFGQLVITISNQQQRVTSITVTSTSGVTTIATNNGALPMKADVLPTNAVNKNVTWSVINGTGSATISASGVLTATGNGKVKARATAADGSGVYGELEITISNQVVQVKDGSVHSIIVNVTHPALNIVVMGDGYTSAELTSGKYFSDMERAINALFTVQPYKAYRSYFNVYILGAVSAVSGIGTGGTPKNTKFSTYHGNGTYMETNVDACFDFVKKNIPIANINTDNTVLDKTLVILVANSTMYGGTTWFSSLGRAIAICPSSSPHSYPYDFDSIVRHEAGGHGFAKLADEYTQTPPPTNRSPKDIPEWHKYNCYTNVDITNDPSKVIWKDFFNKPKYSMVGFWEGGYYFTTGVWRSEVGSCMINNIAYFNAASRLAIVKRIYAVTGKAFSFTEFMATDIIESAPIAPPAPLTKHSHPEEIPPLAPPVCFEFVEVKSCF